MVFVGCHFEHLSLQNISQTFQRQNDWFYMISFCYFCEQTSTYTASNIYFNKWLITKQNCGQIVTRLLQTNWQPENLSRSCLLITKRDWIVSWPSSSSDDSIIETVDSIRLIDIESNRK